MIAAIDFGASMTKAALYRGIGAAEPVLIDREPESSSAVFLQPDGVLICGRAADNNWRRSEWLRTALKRQVNRADLVEPVHQDVEFNVTTLRPLVRCVATVLGHARAAITEQVGDTAVSMLLTHPVGWTEPQRAALLEAAELAGVPVVGLVSEAEAVGWHVCATRRPEGPLLVVDLGASTLDIAVLEVGQAEGIEVLYADGDNSIGGDDFDLEVIALVERALSTQYEATGDPDDAALVSQFRERRESTPHVVEREAERIKLELAAASSDDEVATFARWKVVVDLTRRDFNSETEHLVERIVRRVRDAISYGGEPPRTMVVSGGAARLPSIQQALAELAASSEIELLDWAAARLEGNVTTAVALGATRVPKPWQGTEVRARRPATLAASSIWPGTRILAAVPDGLAILNHGNGSDELMVHQRATPARAGSWAVPGRVTQLSYDSFGRQLITASQAKTICTWELDRSGRTYSSPPPGSVYWRGLSARERSAQGGSRARGAEAEPDDAVTAVAARGTLVAWTESAGPGAIIRRDTWRPYQPNFLVRWLAFTSVPQLLVAGYDRLVLVDPETASQADTLWLAGTRPPPQPEPTAETGSAATVALAAESALVFTADGRRLACYFTGHRRFEPLWRSDSYPVTAMAAGRLDARPVLVVFDGGGRVYRALDARTGNQIALKDAGRTTEPAELLATGTDGVFYARSSGGDLFELTFAEVPR